MQKVFARAFAAFVAILALTQPAFAGPVDTTFGTNGFTAIRVGPTVEDARAVAVQGNGQVIVAGTVQDGQRASFAIARLTLSGLLDTTFGTGGKVIVDFATQNGEVATSMVIQPDGKIIVAGTAYPSSPYPALVRLNMDGSLDTSFGIDGRKVDFAWSAEINAMALQTDGKIVVVGTKVAGAHGEIAVARYNADGSSDVNFGTSGYVTTRFGPDTSDVAYAVKIQADEKLVVAGSTANPQTAFAAVRYNVDGTLDAAFGSGGLSVVGVSTQGSVARALAIQPDGKIVLGGQALDVNNDFALVRLGTDGLLDSGFGAGGVVLTPSDGAENLQALVLQGDGLIVVAGGAPLVAAFVVARYNADGTVDASFGSGGRRESLPGIEGSANALAFSGTTIVVAGYALIDGESDMVVAQYTPDGTLDPAFNGNGLVAIPDFLKNAVVQFRAVKLQADGKIVAAGFSESIPPRFAVARFSANGIPDFAFGDAGAVSTELTNYADYAYDLAIQPDGRIVVVGSAGNEDFGLVRYNADGTLDTSFGTGGKVVASLVAGADGARSVLVLADGKILVAGHTDVAMAVARFNANGTLDATFGTGGYTTVSTGGDRDVANAMVLQPDGKIVIGGRQLAGFTQQMLIARLTASGALDTTFGTGGFTLTSVGSSASTIRDLVLLPDGRILATAESFDGVNGYPQATLVQYLATGALDASFGSGGVAVASFGQYGTETWSVGLQADGRILVSGERIDAFDEVMVARFNANGTPDTSFNSGSAFATLFLPGTQAAIAFALVQQDDGKIVVAGTAIPGGGGVARFLNDAAPPVTPSRAPRDANGDNRSDIFWTDASGQAALWLIDGTSVIDSVLFVGPASGWTMMKATGDHNGDQRADILWRNDDGRWAIWLLDGTGVVGSALLLGPGSGWEVTHVADFDGDGRSDILWKHTDGSVAMWLMNGVTATNSSIIFGPGATWTVSHVADLNNDGRADLVWRNTDGSVAGWLMNGLSATAVDYIFGPGTSWQVIETGDFNGDGMKDLLWRDASGQVSIFLMNGLVATQSTVIYGGGAFEPTHVADFNGDGRSDILMRDTAGQVAVMLMDGVTVTQSSLIFGGGDGWFVTHTGDYDGDGRSDILWKDGAGRVAIWTLNGASVTASAVVFGGGGGWVAAP